MKSQALPTGVCKFMTEINIGIIGAGAWGINHVRTFNQLPGCRVVKVSDLIPENLEKVKGISYNHQGIKLYFNK